MFRLRFHSLRETQLEVFVVLLCLMSSTAAAQEPQALNVNFAFRLSGIDNRFDQISKSDVEKEVTAELAKVCQKQIPYWTFRPGATGVPRLELWLSQKSSRWFVNMSFKHSPGENLKDQWSSVLYAPGDLDTQVLPKNRAWVSKVRTAFQTLLNAESKNEVLHALEKFAPLGTEMATVPTQARGGGQPFSEVVLSGSTFHEPATSEARPAGGAPEASEGLTQQNALSKAPITGQAKKDLTQQNAPSNATVPEQATAVLPLEFDKYRELSLSKFLIMCEWRDHGIVILHSTGTGAPMDFTPDAPKFKGIWVVLNKWDFGGNIEEVSIHVNDLPGLKPRALYLEQINLAPPQMSVVTQ
jgi:hypothetical protein